MSESSPHHVCLPSSVWTAGVILSMGVPFVFAMVLVALLFKRWQTKRLLEGRGLPTVHWRPRFVHYRPFEEDQKLASSTITKILPRMERLNGPFGMYGTVYGISTAVVHVAHPVPARAIFASSVASNTTTSTAKRRSRISSVAESSGASKAPAYNHFKNFCGEGVFTANGDDWKAKRTSVMHCLVKGITNSSTSEISQRLEREANRAADTFCTQLQRLQVQQLKHYPTTIVTTNVVPLLQRSTIGLIFRYITHAEPEWGLDQMRAPKHLPNDNESVETTSLSFAKATSLESFSDNKVDTEVTTSAATGLLESYMNSIIRIRMIILAQSRSIWFLLPRWCYQTFSSLYRDEERTVTPIRQFARTACESAKPGSPLAKLKELESHNRQIPVDGISKDLLDEAITLLFAGQDTSAATLSWTLHLLSIHPDIKSKLAGEVYSVLHGQGMSIRNAVVTRKLISKMPYLDAVVKESMRLYPVAPFVVRQIMQDLPIVDHDSEDHVPPTVLPAKSMVCIWIYGLHRNPKFWNRPDDFVPERWSTPDLKDIGQTNGAYMPFASGPRNCLGQPLAHIILRTLLARLMYRYDFRDERLSNAKDSEALRKDMQAGFTVLPSGGVTLSIHERKQ
jgi:cytochrome P450